jgi:hypothetical protein
MYFARYRADTAFVRASSGSETAVDMERRVEWSPVRSTEGRRPWQDRRMLFRFVALSPRVAAARRIAHGTRIFAKAMKDNHNV